MPVGVRVKVRITFSVSPELTVIGFPPLTFPVRTMKESTFAVPPMLFWSAMEPLRIVPADKPSTFIEMLVTLKL